eukprot:1160224-Pelagomonas_calceolata.AAC.11
MPGRLESSPVVSNLGLVGSQHLDRQYIAQIEAVQHTLTPPREEESSRGLRATSKHVYNLLTHPQRFKAHH